MENGWLKLDFVWRIWKIWTGLDTIRVFQISYRQWLAKGGFSVANFGKFTFEQKFPKFSYQSNISFYFYLAFRLTPTSEWQNVVRHKKIINVTVPSRDGTDFVLQKLIINNTDQKKCPRSKFENGLLTRTVCPRRLSFSQLNVLMSTPNCEKDSLLGQTVLVKRHFQILTEDIFFDHPLAGLTSNAKL